MNLSVVDMQVDTRVFKQLTMLCILMTESLLRPSVWKVFLED